MRSDSVGRDLRADVDRHLAALFGAQAPDLALDANGMAALGFDKGATVTLEVPEHGGRLFAHAPVARLGPANGEWAARRALALNLFRLHRPDFWLALDEESLQLTLCGSLGAERLEASTLGDFLQDVLDCAQGLTEDFARGADPGLAPPPLASGVLILRG